MSKSIEPKDVQEFVWNVADALALSSGTEVGENEENTYGAAQDRFSVALLGNATLFDLLDDGICPREVVSYIESVIKACEHIPPRERDNARYIEALLSNPNLHKMIFGREGVVVKA